MASEFKQNLLNRAKSECRKHLERHVITQYHKSDDDPGRLWKCHQNNSSIYHFWVSAPPGWLMSYGDMGECIWSRHCDMIPFIRGSIKSLDYFSEKVGRDCVIRETYSELIEEWFDEVLIDWHENHGVKPSKRERQIVRELREWWDDEGDPKRFGEKVYESDLYKGDAEMIPCVEWYSYQYLWRIEALKWFIETLDAGKVEKKGDWSWTT